MDDTTTPAGLGWTDGAMAAEAATLDDTPETLTDDEVCAYFPTADRADVLVAYRDAWSEAFQTYADCGHRPCTVCGPDDAYALLTAEVSANLAAATR